MRHKKYLPLWAANQALFFLRARPVAEGDITADFVVQRSTGSPCYA